MINHTTRPVAPALAVTMAIAGLLAIPDAASAQSVRSSGVSAGMLTCNMVEDHNVIVFTREIFDCTYRTARGETGHYQGTFSKIGADLEYKNAQVLKWLVFAPTSRLGPDAIAGGYFGASAEATAYAGVGARVLLGGSDEQITLQPVSVSGQTGLGAAATLDAFRLSLARG